MVVEGVGARGLTGWDVGGVGEKRLVTNAIFRGRAPDPGGTTNQI